MFHFLAALWLFSFGGALADVMARKWNSWHPKKRQTWFFPAERFFADAVALVTVLLHDSQPIVCKNLLLVHRLTPISSHSSSTLISFPHNLLPWNLLWNLNDKIFLQNWPLNHALFKIILTESRSWYVKDTIDLLDYEGKHLFCIKHRTWLAMLRWLIVELGWGKRIYDKDGIY